MTRLERALPDGAAPPVIVKAMRYPLDGGGKRLRPCLTLAVAEALAERTGLSTVVARQLALPFACAVELVAHVLARARRPAGDGRRHAAPRTADDARGLRRRHGGARRRRPADGGVCADLARAVAGRDRRCARRCPRTAGSAASRRWPPRPAPSAWWAARRSIWSRPAASPAKPRALLESTALEDMHARKTGALIRAAATLGAIAVGADAAALRERHRRLRARPRPRLPDHRRRAGRRGFGGRARQDGRQGRGGRASRRIRRSSASTRRGAWRRSASRAPRPR